MALPTLRTERLLLRSFTLGDVDKAQVFRDDADFVKFLPHIPHPFTRSDAEKWVETNIAEPWDQYPTFAIEYEGKLIGDVNAELDLSSDTAMIGYALSREHWGKGFATEASIAVIDWLFGEFDLSKVWASTDINNRQSQRVLEKLGMIRTDILKNDHLDRNGEPVDEVVYEISRNEWKPS